MKILSPTLSRLARLREWRIKKWVSNPIATQREVLQDLATHAQYTAIGKHYGLTSLFSIKEFKKKIPIHEYADIKGYIDRMMLGEGNVLWNTPADWFAKSSGTTGERSKFIPITNESLQDCHYKSAKDVLSLYYGQYPESDLLTGKGLVLGGSHQMHSLNQWVQYGDLSAILLQNSPVWAQWIKTPELSIALMDEWEKKIEQLASATIYENVTSITGVPTWTMVLIKKILDLTGKSYLKEVWPNLELYIHGGVSFVPYREHFSRIIGENINYLEMYNASEGFFAAQDEPNCNGMLLFLDHGIFYEFMPVEEYGSSSPRTIGLESVELSKNYAPVISTNGGLWRYLIGDTVQFTTLHPFRIKVSGRLKHFINAFGEEVIVDNTDKAISEAATLTNSLVSDYTVAPVYFAENSNGGHEWLIEFEKPPQDLKLFIAHLDKALQNLNSDYEAKRYKNIALQEPIVLVLPQGTFVGWLRTKGKLGGQHKVPRLMNDRTLLDEIKQFAISKNI